MTRDAVVVGAGVVGRLCALALARGGARVTLVEKSREEEEVACSFAAAGMLAPLAESVTAGATIGAAGVASILLWKQLVTAVEQSGSWMVALPGDEVELAEMTERLESVARQLGVSPPEATSTSAAPTEAAKIFVPGDGYIDTRAAMHELLSLLREAGVWLRFGETATRVEPFRVETNASTYTAAVVIDTRGLGAAGDYRDLRGVRGELVELHAPELDLAQPVRVLHPRYPIYIVPRPGRHYLVGATQLETASEAPVSVQSALELLGTAHAFHPAFHYASITRLVARARPAFFDNHPRLRVRPGLAALNGLFRHGWLLAPVLAEAAASWARGEPVRGPAAAFVEEV